MIVNDLFKKLGSGRAQFTNTWIFFFLFSFGCKENKSNEESFAVDNQQMKIDTVLVKPLNSSQVGFFQTDGSTVFYVDKLFGQLEEFSLDGESRGIKVREMDGPEQLQGISELIPTPGGFIIRHDWMLYRYSKQWEFLGKSMFEFQHTVDYQEMLERPKGDYIGMYELQTYNSNSRYLPSGDLLIKVDVEHPSFNAFISRDYYKEARVLGKVDIKTGLVKEIMGTRPASYEKYRFLPFHSMMDFAVGKEGDFYLTYEIDSLIYVYDPSMRLKQTFGAEGVGMKRNYPETSSLEVAFEGRYWNESRRLYAYYKDIYVDTDKSLVFRTYRQGGRADNGYDEYSNPLRMQIFRNQVLEMDVAVPPRFRIIGKIGTSYIADGYFNEVEEKQGFYLLTYN
ncbi:MAG: hypothetical protein ACXIUD_07820 [Mongoliitalea sp.]